MCNKFVECYKGLATVKECPPGTEFCVKSLMCDWPVKAVCDRVQMGPGHRVTMSSSVHSVTSSVSSTNFFTPSESSSAGAGYQYQQPSYHQPASDEQYEDISWSGKLKRETRLESTWTSPGIWNLDFNLWTLDFFYELRMTQGYQLDHSLSQRLLKRLHKI